MYLHVYIQKAAEKKKNWRRKHEDFINSIRSAREYTEAETTGISHACTGPLANGETELHVHVHLYVHMCTMYMYVCVHVHIPVLSLHKCVNVQVHVYMYV